MPRSRASLLTAAIVLLFAWLASRVRLDAGIALAVFGLLLAYARGMLAIPVVAILAAAVYAPVAVAAVALFLGLLGLLASALLGMGGAPARAGTITGGWYTGAGIGGDFGGGGDGGGGDCGGGGD